MQLGLWTGIGSRSAGGGGSAPVDGASPTTFSLAPTVHYHPASQTATLDGSSRVLSCPDLQGLASLTGTSFGGSTVGPVEMTDALGRKFWRFRGTDYLLIANALNALSARAVTVMGVWRKHNHKAQTTNFFSPRYLAYTDDTTNTTFAGGSVMRALQSPSGSANFLAGASILASTDATNGYKIIPGCQLHVAGVCSRTTANGGQRLYVNNDVASVSQNSITSTNCTGGVIGGVPGASNAVTASNNFFDLYELAIWKATLSNAEADAAAAAMVSNYAIPAITKQFVLDGDSITDGIATSLSVSPGSGDNIGMQLSAPGAGLVPDGYRVINLGTSGAQTSDTVTERDATNSTYSMLMPGGAANNVVAIQIGRNDIAQSGGQMNSAMLYSAVVAMINTASTGMLQRGWKVTLVANISTAASATTTNNLPGETDLMARLTNFRALIADTTNHVPLSQFLTDCSANTGETYDGLLDVLHLYDVTVSGDTKFKTSTDAQDTASGYFDSDQTHLRVAGLELMVTGGDTPQYGYASIV